MLRISILLAAFLLTLSVTGVANATLVTIGQAHYSGSTSQVSDNDGSYNLVWDNDSPFGSVIYLNYTNSANSWASQVSWASSLSSSLSYTLSVGYNVDWGANNWRLPTTVDGTTWGNDGSTASGYNITTSEFGHIYYTELGNKGYNKPNGYYDPAYGLTNKGELTNLQSYWYWSGTESSVTTGFAWLFGTNYGDQGPNYESYNLLGLAVRSGQVSEVAPVPEPSTMLLLGAGVAGLVFWRRRKTV